jgi:hypothetical protein
VIAAVIAAAVLTSACGDDDASPRSATNPAAGELQAIIASFDLAVGPPRRLLLGLQTGDGRLVAYGTPRVRVRPDRDGAEAPVLDATFVAIAGGEGADPQPSRASLADAGHARGVYAVTVELDEPGIWTAEVELDVEGLGLRRTATQFHVNTEHHVVAVGDRAPASEHHTADRHPGVPLRAVDSRAGASTPLPDPELHGTTIAAALAARRPLVVVFSTPVYCRSRFCGPITDVVAAAAKRYGDRAAFVHVEIYRDFDRGELNTPVREWLQRTPGDINEPWVFVVGSDGFVKARFDNVMTEPELTSAIERLS